VIAWSVAFRFKSVESNIMIVLAGDVIVVSPRPAMDDENAYPYRFGVTAWIAGE
jgi:hypothetical protein